MKHSAEQSLKCLRRRDGSPGDNYMQNGVESLLEQEVDTVGGQMKSSSMNMGSRSVDADDSICRYCETVFRTPEELTTHCLEVHVYPKLRQSCGDCCSELVQLVMNHPCRHKNEFTGVTHQDEGDSNNTEGYQQREDGNSDETAQEPPDRVDVEPKMKRQRVRPKIGINEYKCWHCDLVFTTLRNLREHRINVHRNEKQFKCSICDKAYRRQDSLESHMRSHTGEKPYSCPVCDKAFAMSNALKLHLQTHNNSKMFLCKDCGKSLASMHTLRLHSRIHTGEKPFKCPLCDRTFPRSDAMKSHMRSHRLDRACAEIVSPVASSNSELEKLVPNGIETNELQLREYQNDAGSY